MKFSWSNLHIEKLDILIFYSKKYLEANALEAFGRKSCYTLTDKETNKAVDYRIPHLSMCATRHKKNIIL